METGGSSLYRKFQELLYPKISNFSENSFDWLFDVDESASRFLTWFSQSVGKENLVAQQELNNFQALIDQRVTILEGEHLEEALSRLSKQDNLSDEDLEVEITLLEKQRDLLHEQKLQLANLRDVQSVQRLENADRHTRLEEVHEESLAEKDKMESELGLLESLLADTMDQFMKTSEQLTTELGRSTLLCDFPSWDQFLKNEDQYTDCLKNFSLANFTQNGDSALATEVNEGNTEAVVHQRQDAELARLQDMLPKAEENRISSELQAVLLRASLEELQNISCEVSEGTYPNSETQITFLREEIAQKSSIYHKEYVHLQDQITGLITRSSLLRCSSVLLGDCQWKLARQQQLLKKQERMVGLLAKQWAREQFAVLALAIESQQLDNVLTCLQTVTEEMETFAKSVKKFQVKVEETCEKERLFNGRQTIASSDVFSRCLYAILAGQSDQVAPLIGYSELPKLAHSFRNRIQQSVKALQQLEEKDRCRLRHLESSVKSLQHVAFGDELKSVTQKLSRLDSVAERVEKIEAACEEFQTQLKPILKDFKAKQSAVKNDPLTAVERSLWTLFYNDPAAFQKRVETLRAKANLA